VGRQAGNSQNSWREKYFSRQEIGFRNPIWMAEKASFEAGHSRAEIGFSS
jgi:hypothetical protein